MVIEKVASLEEIEKHWSLEDVTKAHAILEMKSEIINQEKKKASDVYCKRAPGKDRIQN